MKKKTPAYQQIKLLCLDLRMTAQDVAALDEDIATDMVTKISGIESWIDEIQDTYRTAAKKSGGPRVKSAKRSATGRANIQKANAALDPEARKERARKAAAARWTKKST